MNKYLVVLLPSQQVNDYIKSLREKLQLKYSRTIEPHLTLIPPFSAKAVFPENLVKTASETTPFTIKLGPLDSFANPRKITYFSVRNPGKVALLRSKLAEELKEFGPFLEEFIPHITLAKEVDRDLFNRIQQRVSENKDLQFRVDSFYLFKKDGQIWEEVSKFRFKKL